MPDMRPGITTKLFLGVLATSVLVALVMAAAGQAGFRRDFRTYVEAAELRRVEALAETLGGLYAETGDWSAVASSERRWRSLLRTHPRPADQPAGELRGEHRSGPGRAGARIALYDAGGVLLAGGIDEASDTLRVPVMVDGQTVGWIARARSRQPTEMADLRFQQAQFRNLGIAALAAVLFAALAAALLSRTFLAPARAIGQATHRLAAGDFTARAQVNSHDEFGRLADDFNVLAHTLERNESMRRSMMADVAHELRTPLAIMQGELAAVQDGVRTFSPETLTSLQAEARALGKLVDDLYQLALSDVGALDYRRRDLDLRALVTEALQPLRERCATAGLALNDAGLAGEPLPVHADPDRLVQMVTNLVENSLRYTDAPGRIEVCCGREDGRVVLRVADSAPGVTETQLARLFERFFRGEASRGRAGGGAGLGLAICRNIVEAHNGTITAEPSALGGLEITVSLPLLRTPS